jgi:hypothetical protein
MTSRDTFDAYAAIDAVNWSSLKEMRTSPKHYKAALNKPRKDTKAMLFGRAAHCAALEPDEFPRRFVLWDGGIRRGADWEQFRMANRGRQILDADDYQAALAVRDEVRSHRAAVPYLAAGEAERTLTWTDAETGLACKGRLDWISTSRPAIVDLKTARSIDERICQRVMLDLGYHIQLGGAYRSGLIATRPETPPDLPCVLIWVESAPPHDVAVRPLDENAAWNGEQEWTRLLKLLVECRRTGKWPGRFPDEGAIDLPAWFYTSDGAGAATVPDPDFMEEAA